MYYVLLLSNNVHGEAGLKKSMKSCLCPPAQVQISTAIIISAASYIANSNPTFSLCWKHC